MKEDTEYKEMEESQEMSDRYYTADEFITNVIERAYWEMPKEYRQYEFNYLEKSEKFTIALEHIGYEEFKSMLDKYLAEAEESYPY